jgi:O-Antigen ligase
MRTRLHFVATQVWLVFLGVGVSGLALLSGVVLVRLGSFQHQLKATLLGVALLASAAVVVYPLAAFPAILALAPFEFPLRLAGRQAGTNEVLAIGLALVLAPRLRLRETPRWAAIGFSCLVVGSFGSLFAAADRSQALWGSVRWLAISVVGLAAFQMLRARTSAAARCADIISATAIVVGAFALLQGVGIYWIVGRPYLTNRVDSSFGYYTVYAGYMMVAALVATGAAIEAGRRREPLQLLIHASAAPLAALGLGVSLSRGALAGAVVGAVAMIALNLRRPEKTLVVAAVLASCVGVAWLVLPGTTRTQFAQRFAQPVGSSGSDREHFALQRIGQTALEAHPLGLGYGNFPLYMTRSGATDEVGGRAFFHAHRLPTQIGLDAGWLGFAGFVILALAPLVAATRAAREKRLSPTAAGMAGALVALLAQGWFDYLFYELSFLVIFAALVWGTWHALQPAAAS